MTWFKFYCSPDMFNVEKKEGTLLPIVTIVYDGLEKDNDQQDTDSVTDDTEGGKAKYTTGKKLITCNIP